MPEGENGAKWTESQTKVLPYETYAHVAGRGGMGVQQPKACSENMQICGEMLKAETLRTSFITWQLPYLEKKRGRVSAHLGRGGRSRSNKKRVVSGGRLRFADSVQPR